MPPTPRAHIFEFTEMPSDPLRGASGRKRLFAFLHLGKANEPDFPFTIANELVASFIGAALGLHVAPAFPHRYGDEPLVLIQMSDRDDRMQEGPPATASAIQGYVSGHPTEVHGAVIFDLYIANNDRAFGPERRNLLLDGRGRLLLYDHGNSCYYRRRASIEPGVPRLHAVAKDLRALADMDHKNNVYRQLLTRWDLVEFWCARIEQLPDYVIEAAVDQIPEYLSRPTPEERVALRDFLLSRRRQLLAHIVSNPSMFPNLRATGVQP